MAKNDLKSLLSRLLPYVTGKKQKTALFAVLMLLALSCAEFDAPHVHGESAEIEVGAPTVMMSNVASGSLSQWASVTSVTGP